MPVKIGEMLSKEGLITPQQLQEALAHQKQNGVKLGRALVSLGFVKDTKSPACFRDSTAFLR